MKIVFEGSKDLDEIKSEELSAMYKSLFLKNKEGEYILHDLAKRAGIIALPYCQNSDEMMKYEGMRNLYHYIASQLKLKPEQAEYSKDYNPFEDKK